MAFRIPGEGGELFRRRMDRARQAQETQERTRQETVRRRITHREITEETDRIGRRLAYDLYLLTMRIIARLEEIRDRNAPKKPDDEWNSEFRAAVEAIPEAKMFLEEMSINMIEDRR